MVKDNGRIFYIALLSVISAIAVVFCHANEFDLFDNNPNWAIRNIIEGVTYFAVPVFFMITGAMLLDFTKKYSLPVYFTKRAKKTLIPFLFWSLVAIVWSVLLKKTSADSLNIISVVNGILCTSYFPAYWFFIDLFRVYLWIPVFANIKDENKGPVCIYFISCLFVLDSLIPFICDKYGIVPYFEFNLSQNYLIYALIGYVLSKYEIAIKWRRSLYFLAIVSILALIIGTYVLSVDSNSIQYIYSGYKNIPCIFYSIGVFLFVKNLTEKVNFTERFKTSIYFLSKFTFSIYLLHMFIVDAIKLYLPYAVKTSIPCILAIPVITIPICILFTVIIRKIPVIKHVLPE